MLEFMDSMRQEIKCGKEERARQDKMIELLMMQGARPSSATKKLAKANMPSTFSGLGKARKVKEFLLEMDNYYDVQKPEEGDKVSIAVTFVVEHKTQAFPYGIKNDLKHHKSDSCIDPKRFCEVEQ